MLIETVDTRQIPGEPFRRWFSDTDLDLIVWYGTDKMILGFQLCYKLGAEEKVLTWFKGKGYGHNTLEDGESRPGRHKMTPILIPDGTFEAAGVLSRFNKAVGGLDADIVGVVRDAIAKYPGQ